MINNFKDLNITPIIESFVGDKKKRRQILNIPIQVLKYRIQESKYAGKGQCLHLQIQIGDIKHVVFTGASILASTLKMIPEDKFPFLTTIIEKDEHFEFS